MFCVYLIGVLGSGLCAVRDVPVCLFFLISSFVLWLCGRFGFCTVACVFVLSVLKCLKGTIFLLSLVRVGVGLSLMVGEGSVGG